MFEKKLLKLLEDSKRRRILTRDNSELGYYNECQENLKKFIFRKLNNRFLKNRYARIVSDHFDEILPFIVRSSTDIFYHISLLMNQPGFKEKFLIGLKNYPYKNCIADLIYLIRTCLPDLETYNSLIDKEVLEYVASLDLSIHDYWEMLDVADEDNQRIFLELLCKNKANIPYLLVDCKGNNKQIIYDNLPLFLQNSRNLYDLLEFAKDNPEAYTQVKEYIDSHEEQAISSVFCETDCQIRITDPQIKEIITMVIKEVVENEKVKYSEITYSGGGFSRVLFVGNKVIKLGDRFTKSISNNPYIVAPIIRQEIINNEEACFIEVTERVDTDEEPTEEDLYALYRNLRDLGLIWTDIKGRNVGKLRKDNVIHWNGELTPTEEALHLLPRRGKDVLKAGEWVILDADFIYDENDKDINYVGKEEICTRFEERYQEEKRRRTYVDVSPSIQISETEELEESSGRSK